jgi:dipeptidyl-peptidase-3
MGGLHPGARRDGFGVSRRFLLEQVDDVAVVQIYADGFGALSPREKLLAWHLYLAAIAGRDIYYDQRHAYNLELRGALEGVLTHAAGLPAAVVDEVRRYTKLFWINSGPHNGITARKQLLRLSVEQWTAAVAAAAAGGAPLPLRDGEAMAAFAARLAPVLFDPDVDPVLTQKTPGGGRDILETSANNLYVNVSMPDLQGFVEQHALNSRLVKAAGGLIEEVWRVGGRYDREIRRIVRHLEDALPYAPTPTADALRALIRFYTTGDDADRLAYDIAWVRDDASPVDTVNGFVEVYLDPRGAKGAWEGLVSYVNHEKTRRIDTIAANAQWFEDHAPWEARFRKASVTGVSARAIDVVIETGDSGPLTPVGINLPNDQAVRERYGSKSVLLANVNEAYERSTPEGLRAEFSWDEAEADRTRQWGVHARDLSTELHEVIGHGSGRMAEGVTGSPPELLREHYSALEETRSDLVALYFLPDPKLVELGVVPRDVHDTIVRTEYEQFTRGVLVQLRRVREGEQLEEDHMRNRQLIVNWLLRHTTAIEIRRRDNKTYYTMVDPVAFRAGVARLLAQVQRIKSEGDYDAARGLVEAYGVHFDPALRDEVVARVDALRLPSYSAFVMPRLAPVRGEDGTIVDVEVSYPCDLESQMLEYAAMSRAPIA